MLILARVTVSTPSVLNQFEVNLVIDSIRLECGGEIIVIVLE